MKLDVDDEATASHKIVLPNGANIVKSGYVEKRSYRRIIPTWLQYIAVIDDQNNLYLFSGGTYEYKVFIVDIHVQYLTPKDAFGRKYAFAINNFSSSSYSSFRKKYCSCFSSSSKSKKYSKKMMILTTTSESETSDWVDSISAILRKGQSSMASLEYESLDSVSAATTLPPINPKKLKQARLQEQREKLRQLEEGQYEDDDAAYPGAEKVMIPVPPIADPMNPDPSIVASYHENEFLEKGGVALTRLSMSSQSRNTNTSEGSGHVNPIIALAAADPPTTAAYNNTTSEKSTKS